jgi:hypothetical protein
MRIGRGKRWKESSSKGAKGAKGNEVQREKRAWRVGEEKWSSVWGSKRSVEEMMHGLKKKWKNKEAKRRPRATVLFKGV